MSSRVKEIASRFEQQPTITSGNGRNEGGREGVSSTASTTSTPPMSLSLGTRQDGQGEGSTSSSSSHPVAARSPSWTAHPSRLSLPTSTRLPPTFPRPNRTSLNPHPLLRISPPHLRVSIPTPMTPALSSTPRPTATSSSSSRSERRGSPSIVSPSAVSPATPLSTLSSSTASPKSPSYKSLNSFTSTSTTFIRVVPPPVPPTASRSPIAAPPPPIFDGLPPISSGQHPLLSFSTPLIPSPPQKRVDPPSGASTPSPPPPLLKPPAPTLHPILPFASDPATTSPHPHSPVLATTVFSRSALPLSIPHLDEFLASLPPVVFSPFATDRPAIPTGESKTATSGVFPPFDVLGEKGAGAGGKAVVAPGEWIRRGTWNLVGSQQVKRGWARPKVLLDMFTGWSLGAEGSNSMSSLYSLEGAYGAVQVVALVLESVATLGQGDNVLAGWRKVFLGSIPNILALNFPSVFGQSIAFLITYQALALLLLFFFRRVAKSIGGEQDVREGFATMKWVGWKRRQRAGVMIMSFGLIVLYLPMSTMAVHALLWTSDFWVIPNPFLTEDNPASIEKVKFCYTTNNASGSINWAPLILITSAFTFIFVTFYFPIKMWLVIRANLPRVDRWTELGRKRSATELEHEFQRVLNRDENPFNFLYRGYRRKWGSYRAFYLVVKLVALLVVAVFSKDNCLFYTFPRAKIDLIRQCTLIGFLVVFLVIHLLVHPFIDSRSNASEMVSRSTYVAMATIGLLVLLDVKGKEFFDTWCLYFVYVISYGGNVWFTIVNWVWVQTLIQRFQKRLDFSMDIFSPHLDLSSTSPHLKRRIWQETLTTVFLASPMLRMPADQHIVYSEPQGQKWPPYLVNFRGSVAERHVENLKILREVGSAEYYAALDCLEGPDRRRWEVVREQILLGATGPDSYFRPSKPPFPSGVTSFFGHAWLVPFPLTLIMRYDQAREPLVLTDLESLELYLLQNSRESIRRRRLLRTTLRSLEGQTLFWPYTISTLVGKQSSFPACLTCRTQRTSYDSLVTYTSCTLVLTRQGSLPWKGHDLGSGFEVRLKYSKAVYASSSEIGLSDDFAVTSRLAEFLSRNEGVVRDRLPGAMALLDDYRSGMAREVESKREVMGYGFLRDVFETEMGRRELERVVEKEVEKDGRVRWLAKDFEREFKVLEERRKVVHATRANSLWFLFWDDIWRRNRFAIPQIRSPLWASDFSPYSPTSIAYRPLPRAALIAFLTERDLWSTTRRSRKAFFGNHILNLLYWSLNEAQFHDIPVHLSTSPTSLFLSHLPPSHSESHSRFSSSLAGTELDESQIRDRRRFEFEEIYTPGATSVLGKVSSWVGSKLGVARFERTKTRGKKRGEGMRLGLRREGGEYVVI